VATDFASIALIAWAPMVLIFFARFRPATAATLSYLGAYLLLPVGYGFNVPVLPPLARMQLVTLVALAGILFFRSGALRGARVGRGLDWLAFAVSISSFATTLANSDSMVVGETVLPALQLRDGISNAIRDFVWIGLPFLYGRILVKRPADLYPVLVTYAVAGVCYSVLVLWEVRMAPTLHADLYGFESHGETSFSQTVRGEGWRPQVFVGSGLALSLLIAHMTICAVALAKAHLPVLRLPRAFVAPYLYALLLVCKSVGAIVLGTLAASMQLVLSARTQIRVAAIVCLVAIGYPLMRSADLVPMTQLENFARSISDERYVSLNFRFREEERLFDKARERIWLGWGTYGRNSVYDPETGQDTSIADGYWIISIGSFGIVGYLSRFLLFAAPVWLAFRRWNQIRGEREQLLVLALVWILTTQIVDMIPNAMIDSVHFFLCGALVGSVYAPARVPARARRERRAISEVIRPDGAPVGAR
jgi:hypothetical protein